MMMMTTSLRLDLQFVLKMVVIGYFFALSSGKDGKIVVR